MRAKVLAAIGAVAVVAAAVYFFVKPGVREGREIFEQEGCVKCHVFYGLGIGPIDLSDIATRRTDAWIRTQLNDSRMHDPSSGMPRFGYLSKREIDVLIAFLHTGR